MADTGSPTEAAPAAGTPSPGAGGDLSLADIIAQEVATAASEGRSLTPPEDAPEGTPPAGDKPAETPATEAPAAEGAPETAEAPPEAEPTPSEARRILAAAEKRGQDADRKLAEARQLVERSAAELLAGLQRNPKATLAKLGTTLDQLIDASLDEGDAPAPPAPKTETEYDKRLRALEEREQRAELNAKIAETHSKISADKRFPTINAKGQQELVTTYMVTHYQRHGAPIAWDVAAARVEKELRGLTGGAAPAARPAPAAPAARPGTDTLKNSEVRTASPAADEDPTVGMDPDRALRWLVEHGP